MVDEQRRTGRTTRMIQEALARAAEGATVYVVFATQAQMVNLYHHFAGTGVNVIYSSCRSIDWKTMTVRGAPRNSVVFFDHFAIEQRKTTTA